MSTSNLLLSFVQPRNLVVLSGVVELSVVRWTVTITLSGYC